MRLQITNRTRFLHGAHATTMLANDFLASRIEDDYGPAVDRVDVMVVYPPKTNPSRWVNGGFSGFLDLVQRSPNIRFHRSRRSIALSCVCSMVSVRRIQSGGHLSVGELAHITQSVTSVLELIRGKVGREDHFDCDRFLDDARAALDELPEALASVLTV